MPRTKSYKKEEVLEKAMNLFWKNGYETTSMKQLEAEMGINKFSIYSSFGSKSGLLKASLACYVQKLNIIVQKLIDANDNIDAFKQYFYDFIEFSKENNFQKGCLITNTVNEDIKDEQEDIQNLLTYYITNLREVFAQKLKKIYDYNDIELQEKADYLFIAMFGFSSASKVFNSKQLDNYIRHIFSQL